MMLFNEPWIHNTKTWIDIYGPELELFGERIVLWNGACKCRYSPANARDATTTTVDSQNIGCISASVDISKIGLLDTIFRRALGKLPHSSQQGVAGQN
jgi:hypothetical protein